MKDDTLKSVAELRKKKHSVYWYIIRAIYLVVLAIATLY